MPRLKAFSKEERKSLGVALLQRCVRGHIGRRAFWRHRKLWIHARESRQATKLQKVFRGHAARLLYQKLHSVQVFMQFMAAKKGGKFSKGMSPQQLELYAVCLVQAAWRRKMAYRAAIKRRRLMRFLEYLRSKDVQSGKKGANKGSGFFEAKKKKIDERKKVVMEYLGPTSRYPTVTCLKQLSMQQVQQFLNSMLYRVFKGALGRFLYKKASYKAKHGDYLEKIIKVQAFQRGRVVRKQVMERRRNARLKQLAVRMFKQAEFRCFNMWRSAWQECKYKRQMLTRFMAAWMRQPLRKAFNSIVAVVDESREKKEKLKRVAKLMQNVKNKWRDICFSEWAALKAQIGDRNKEVINKMKGFMGNYTLELCRSVILAWSAQQKKTKRAMMLWKKGAMVQGWWGWREIIKKKHRGQEVVLKMRERYRLRPACYAFNVWLDNIQDRISQKCVIVDVIETWKRCPHPAFAFRRWFDNLMEAKYYKKTIGKVLERIKMRGVVMAFSAWSQNAHAGKQAKDLLKRISFRMKNQSLIACWNEWSGTVKKKHKYGDAVNIKGKRALARMLNECLFRCFAAWSEHIQKSRRNKETLKRVKYMIHNKCVVQTFNSWRMVLVIAAEERLEALRQAIIRALDTHTLDQWMVWAATSKSKGRYKKSEIESVMREVLSEEHHVLDHILTGAPLPKEDDDDEEQLQQQKIEQSTVEQPVKMRQQSHCEQTLHTHVQQQQQQQQQQQHQNPVRLKAPIPPSKRQATSKQRRVSPQQQRGRAVTDPSLQNQLIANIGTNYHRRSPSPVFDDGFGDAIVDINEAPADSAPHSGQVIPRYLANQMAAGAKQQMKLSRGARSISPSIDFRAQSASGSNPLWEQGVGTRVLLGDVKMGNFVDIMEMDLVPIGDVKVPTKSFSQVQSNLKSFNHSAVRRNVGVSLPAIPSNARTISHGL